MIDTAGSHGGASFWLDVADRVIKFLALLVGAAWTWMHYTRSRTYAEKLELDLEAKLFPRNELYLETVLRLKNLGAAKHTLLADGTMCNVWAVRATWQNFHCSSLAYSEGKTASSRERRLMIQKCSRSLSTRRKSSG